jgi:hypothetical protein
MKKFSFHTTLLLVSMVVVIFSSCQKEQAAVTPEAEVVEGRGVAAAGVGPYSGSINSNYAQSLAANYYKKYGSDDKSSQSVAFSAKDLIAFINSLKTKYKSDIIYVNFGVYGKGAAPVSAKDYGRLTVFFTGNNMPGSTAGGRRSDGAADDLNYTDQFLNHGGLCCP